MIDSRQPQVSLEPNSTNSNPLAGYPSCLVDDPVYLVDSSLVLVGSLVASTTDIRIETSSTSPRLTGGTAGQHGDTGSDAPHTTISIRR
jgi:hypothetical protein